MSINSAMLSGVTGLIADSSALSGISDNIANSQTVGYKTTDVAFETLVTGQNSASAVSAGGVAAVASQNIEQQGTLQTTTSPTDLGISGNGFFVTTQNASSPTTTTPVLFTRAGSFTADSNGFLRNSAGLYLQGWPLDAQGQVLSDPTNLTKLQPINVTAIAGAAVPTTTVSVNANVLASQAISTAGQNGVTETAGGAPGAPPVVSGAVAGGYDPTSATMSMAAYDPTTGVGVKPDFSIQLPVSDSKGSKQTFQLDLLKSSVPNQWYAELVANPASAVTAASGVPAGQAAFGIVAFTPTGQYDPTNSVGIFASNSPVLSLGASPPTSGTNPPAGQVEWAYGLGDAAQNITFTFGGNGAGLTQFDSPSTVSSIAANGTTFGNLANIQVGSNGAVTAIFDNGVTREIAQIALATVPNADGMTAAPGNAYTISNQSGTATLKIPGQGGAGTISPSTLEASTVDLSTEFTSLIQTQQAYTAASKIITTANQMLTTLLQSVQ